MFTRLDFSVEDIKVSVNFHTFNIDDYQNGEYRKATVCVVRRKTTGTPYSGIAILNPDPFEVDDKSRALYTSSKRAFMAFAVGEFGKTYQQDEVKRIARMLLARFCVVAHYRFGEDIAESDDEFETLEYLHREYVERRKTRIQYMDQFRVAVARVRSEFQSALNRI